ncbi:hypothetical protein MXB_2534 [Myxobolus squamalis]|nr:hypothetical protein MXB_2534 [Myxobolus squamalis]
MTPCYTANFVAPEVLKQQGYDAACDIWSLGVVLYVLISGITPYMNQDEEDSTIILDRITHGQIDLTTGVWPKVSEEAKQLIYSMVHLDPSVRPSANQILTHSWIVNKGMLSNVRLQQDSWRLKDAMKIMFSAFRSSNEVNTFSSVNNSGILKRRALKKKFKH